MRLDLFSEGDNVLLLGEGNFSFAKCLVNLKLPIKITATCLDNGTTYKDQADNIQFLIRNKIPVFANVNGTKLHEHSILKTEKYSKIIFNFPHVGGKMKIQLNRTLIRNVCESSCNLLSDGGLLIISLCNGQGGTPADNPQRKWEDSWQVTEMAAFGNFCLISVEPFDFNNFKSYNCTGYRSQDVHFNLKGALVHVFKKRVSPSRLINEELVSSRLFPVPLWHGSKILVPVYYSELYENNPLRNSKSAVSFVQNLLLKQFQIHNNSNVKILNDNNISDAFENSNEIIHICHRNGTKQHSSAIRVIDKIIEECSDFISLEKIIFLPRKFLNSCLHDDFQKTCPISFQFILLGANVSTHFKNILSELRSLFQIDESEISKRRIFSCLGDVDCNSISGCKQIVEIIKDKIPNCAYAVEWQLFNNVLGHELILDCKNNLEIVIIYVEKIIELLFVIEDWKEYWSEHSYVYLESEKRPTLKQFVLYPTLYTFDITLRYATDNGLSDDEVYEKLRIAAIDLIKQVKMINQYDSGLGWSSKCFRITYQSLSEPLNRSKALSIHTNLIAKVLTLSLPVAIK